MSTTVVDTAENQEQVLLVAEVAKALRVSKQTVRRWIKSGKIKVVRLPSGRYRLPQSDLQDILTPYYHAAPVALGAENEGDS